jgi:ArsR family transcriptional regulator, arsenate/arsenite/antimonite-responsive transcriptional repressor
MSVNIPMSLDSAVSGGLHVTQADRVRSQRVAALARVLSDPVRVQLVDLIRRHGEPLCQCELVALFELSQPTLSHHLRKLREAGVISVERRGSWAYYAVVPDALEDLHEWLF